MSLFGPCLAASGPGRLSIIDGPMHPELYQQILKGKVRTSVSELDLKRNWVMRQDGALKHISCLQRNALY